MRKSISWVKRTSLWIVLIPLFFYYFGAGLNQIVLYANHDKFPVMVNDAKLFEYHHTLEAVAAGDSEADAEQAQILLVELDHGFLDDTHCVMTNQTKLNWLADWIDLRTATYSIGDLTLMAGDLGMTYSPIIWVVVALTQLSRKRDKEESYAV